MPIGAAGSPHFADFMNPKDSQSTKPHHLLDMIRQIRQASLTEDFNGELDFRINRLFRQSGNEGFLAAIDVFPIYKSENRRGNAGLPMGNYWEIWVQICASSFSGIISVSGSR